MSAETAAAQDVRITLPDGSVRTYTRGVTGAEIAASIGAGLAKAALAVRIDGDLCDLDLPIETDAGVAIVTRKDDDALELIRHDAAHLMAMAVQELYPGTQVTIGPTIQDGFYYDFAREEPFTPEDLEKIEAKMKEIVARDVPTRREVWDRRDAINHFKEIGEHYKAQIIEEIPKGEDVRIYWHGDWHDLCRGPHLMSSSKVGTAFKLTKLAGAYWRGDAKNAQLQRIYGTAWRDEKELAAYLHRIEEAERRDHRRLAREMELFHVQEEAPGMVFWHPKGWTIYLTLEAYMRRKLTRARYVEVRTPQLVDRKLWEESGHWEKFREHMFTAEVDEDHAREKRVSALKPMNCPCHVQIFNQGLKSYRDLPLRMAEFGSCHRYEPSGALHGIMRVRAFTQDDAHIFCAADDIANETRAFIELLSGIYRDLGFEEFRVKFSDRPEVRAGSDETWDRAENALKEATAAAGCDYTLNPGEGAFYGPKLEFVLRDAIGRDWQCGTLQVDFVLPERLDASYIGEDGQRHRPVMLHRAILGSFERFIGILIEQYAGRFPLWLSPVQASVATIVSDADGYAREVADALTAAGLRVETDLRNEKINYKIRELSHAKIPVIVVVGKKEAAERTVSVRRLGSQQQETLALDELVSILKTESTPPDLR
ncbi:MAG: threonine--tRNA ligase [Alphaproteobacteria bacterium]|nr:threonine--tRNA ligase [Alphaproteobacteria bacterium]MDX5370147.1 threonine--tRNA ligase [Alphaproteobacteria bacterium]MDX5464704.1 threonine--tRNA ligase [Alphaproteobacteria bacterium]